MRQIYRNRRLLSPVEVESIVVDAFETYKDSEYDFVWTCVDKIMKRIDMLAQNNDGKFEVTNRGKNTKEHWENSHKKFIEDWEKVKNEDFSDYVMKNWYHYIFAMNDAIKDVNLFTYKSVLDVGSAPNMCLPYFANLYKDVKFTGIDFTDVFLDWGRKFSNISNLNFVKMDFLTTPIEGKHDVILLLECIEHVENNINFKLIDELVGKCKYLYVSTPIDNNQNGGEHISFYDVNSFDKYNVLEKNIVATGCNFIKCDSQDILEAARKSNLGSAVLLFKIKGNL